MELTDLGYTEKWMRYGLLSIEILNDQFIEFQKGDDQNTEHYRYWSFLNWLQNKEDLTNEEIENFIELAHEDKHELMAGSALKELFTSTKITANQFEFIKQELPKFGDWTTKLISRETLKRRIKNENLTNDLLRKCVDHTKKFKENVLVTLIIKETQNQEFITRFTTDDYGKKVRNLANEKLKVLKKSGNTV